MSKYPFTDIEKKWQKYWEDHDTFHVTEDPSFPTPIHQEQAFMWDTLKDTQQQTSTHVSTG